MCLTPPTYTHTHTLVHRMLHRGFQTLLRKVVCFLASLHGHSGDEGGETPDSLFSTALPVSVTSSKVCVRFCDRGGSACLTHIDTHTHICTYTYTHLGTTDLDKLSNFTGKPLEAQDSWNCCVTSLVS